jgi:hypothetical protein
MNTIMESKEYERREKFLVALKQLSNAEYLEILRLLQKKNVHYSENTNGVFFDIVALDQEIFDSLEKFIDFVKKNRAELSEREVLINSFKQK